MIAINKNPTEQPELKTLVYDILKCPEEIIIPLDDQQAWLLNEPYRDLYNRQKLIEFQGLYHAIMPIKPISYPVFLKPLVNLYKTGHEVYLLHDDKDFYKHWDHTGFWMEYLCGDHLSYDIILENGQIKWSICFQGHYVYDKKNRRVAALFDYWEHMPDQIISPIIHKLVEEKLSNYSGCLNIQTLNQRMIECHLRINWLKWLPDHRILVELIRLYQGNKWQLNLDYRVPKLYLMTIWARKSIKNNRVMQYVMKICNEHNIFSYQCDRGKKAPLGRHRILRLASFDYESARECKNKLIKLLIGYGYGGLC